MCSVPFDVSLLEPKSFQTNYILLYVCAASSIQAQASYNKNDYLPPVHVVIFEM